MHTPCKHLVHNSCGKSWFKLSAVCPICRFDLRSYFESAPPSDSC